MEKVKSANLGNYHPLEITDITILELLLEEEFQLRLINYLKFKSEKMWNKLSRAKTILRIQEKKIKANLNRNLIPS